MSQKDSSVSNVESGSSCQGIVSEFESFFRSYYRRRINEFLQEASSESANRLTIDEPELAMYSTELSDLFEKDPETARRNAEQALENVLPEAVDDLNVNIALRNLPFKTEISDINSNSIGGLVEIDAVVRAASEVWSFPREATYECQRCGNLNSRTHPVTAPRVKKPEECIGCERSGPFERVPTETQYVDMQQLVLEQRTPQVDGSDTVESITAYCDYELTGEVDPGDAVTVVGVVQKAETRYDSTTIPDKYIHLESMAEATVFDVTETGRSSGAESVTACDFESVADQDDVFDEIVASISPSVQGYETEKKILALQLFSGVQKENADAALARGNIHVAFIGSPDTAVQTLAENASKLAPVSVHASGTDTTQVGLTSAATRNGGRDTWTVEGGVLSQANGGIACLTRFDSLSKDAQKAVEDVLHRQKLEVAKGNVKTTFPAETSVVMTAVPSEGYFDEYSSVAEQLPLSPGVLTHCDLVVAVEENDSEQSDTAYAEQILEQAEASERVRAAEHTEDGVTDQVREEYVDPYTASISPQFLRRYIQYAREWCHPVIDREAKTELAEFYTDVRVAVEENERDNETHVALTNNLLQSLVRLTEASARTRLSDTADKEDADRAISLVEHCLKRVNVIESLREPAGFDADMIETAQSVAQRSREEELRSILQEKVDQLDDDERGVVKGEVMAEATQQLDASRDTLEKDWETLRTSGEVYEPANGKYRLT